MKKLSCFVLLSIVLMCFSTRVFAQEENNYPSKFSIQISAGLTNHYGTQAALLGVYDPQLYFSGEYSLLYQVKNNWFLGGKIATSMLNSHAEPVSGSYAYASITSIDYTSGYQATFLSTRSVDFEIQSSTEIGYTYLHRSVRGLADNPFAGHSTLHGLNIGFGVQFNSWFGDIMVGMGADYKTTWFFKRINPNQPDKGTFIYAIMPKLTFGIRL